MEKNNASSTNVELEIVHAVRGRLRLRLKGDDARELLSRLAHHLQQEAGIRTVETKQTNNSLVVVFDPKAISVEQLIDTLSCFGSIKISAKNVTQSTGESHAITYGRLFSLIPPLVGLAIARSLKVSGWKSILTYILAAGVTREVIDQVTEKSDSEESENVKLSPAQPVLTTEEIAVAEISSLLTARETDYEIVHHIPGRIRLRVPRISRDYASRNGKADRTYVQELKRLLEQDKRIIDLRFKTNSNSVVILYDPKAFADFNQEKVALDDSKGKKAIDSGDKSESLTIPDQKSKEQKPAIESDLSDLNDTPPPGEGISSEPRSLTLETETESTTVIADDESEIKTHQEFTNKQTMTKTGYWSSFKSSMLLTMLKLMANSEVQTAEI